MTLRFPAFPVGPAVCNKAIKNTKENNTANAMVLKIRIPNLLNSKLLAKIKKIPEPMVVIAPLTILTPISLRDT